MFTDMVGYTSLTQRDESLAMGLLAEQRSVIRPFLARHDGKEIKTMGDAFLVEFDSALEAARCAFDIQQSLHELNLNRPFERKILLRIGIHLGDTIHTQNDVFGDAVNIASRIEPLASPGGVCVSTQVYDQIRNKFEFPLSSLGKRELKNVGDPVEVFRVIFPWENHAVADASRDKRRIAVLPFVNLSSGPEEGYFADGMTEELITSLSGVRQLTVIARTSVMGYKGTNKKVKEIARELDVGSILEGSVRTAGNRLRITAQLVDTATEGHLWAQNYDRQLEDVFAIQSEIAEKVAAELKVRLVEDEKRVIEKRPTENTEAYTYYLKGRELLRERTEPSLRQAVEMFQKATSVDPSFARAYVGIAECFGVLANDSYESYELAAPKAELAVRRALQLDPDLAEGHAVLAYIGFLEDNTRLGEAEAEQAIKLNPSLADAYWELHNVAFVKQQVSKGISALETCYRLDPIRPQYVEELGRFYFYLGRERDALRHWEKTEQLAPAGTCRAMTEYYLCKGDIEKAKELYSKSERLEPTNRWLAWMKGFIAAQSGDKEGALLAIKEIEKNWLGAVDLNAIAFVYYGLGDLDSYFAYINKATDHHQMRYRYVIYSPLFAKSRQDPRYQALMDKIIRINEAS